jgi:hypothetical protein
MAVLLCIRWQPCVRKLRTMRANIIYERCTSYKLRDVRARVFGTTNLNIFTNNQQPTTTTKNVCGATPGRIWEGTQPGNLREWGDKKYVIMVDSKFAIEINF